MRHSQLQNPASFDVVDVEQLWPGRGTSARQAPVDEAIALQRTTTVPDVPKSVGLLIATVYAALLAAFPLMINHDGPSAFAIVISAFYLFMFFAVPAVFLKVEKDPARRPDMSRFLHYGIETATGRISGKGALVQMLVVPVALTFGVLAMGVTYLLS